jgi:phenylacetate-CoA ligase
VPITKNLRWELLERYRPDAVIATPSFALQLGKLAEQDGFDLAGVGVKRVLVSGETFAEARRRDIERYWGCPGGVRSFYGLSEGGPMLAGSECEAQDGMHLFEDRAIHQYWEPDTDVARLVGPGELGEYTFTNLDQRTLATWFNFRTRDSATFSDEPCSCGRPGRRMWIHDRLDDMRKIRGINVFASGVEALIREIPTLAEEFQLVVTEDELSRVKLTAQAESRPGIDPSTLQEDAQRLREKLQTAFGLRMEVEIKSFGELPRWELKARRWLDHRSKA